MASDWIAYNQLAWVDEILSSQEDFEIEIAEYISALNQVALNPLKKVLHLGCGAGAHDFHLKKHFQITGADLSKGMLDIARKRNPEINYIEGDMRKVELNEKFDVVIIPDSIDYISNIYDLEKTLLTSAKHLDIGGVLFIACKTLETFQNNNFVYSGKKGEIEVTLFENNYINKYKPNTYDITLFYMIRNSGELTTFSETATGGIFEESIWNECFRKTGFEMTKFSTKGIYENYILDDGQYPITFFAGTKIR